MLTLPKLLDQPIVIVNKPTSPADDPSLHWSTPRAFIEKASEYAADHSIYVPPLFREHITEEHTTDNALTPIAFSWAITVARRMGIEVEMFDSLYSACNHIESPAGIYTDWRVRDLIEFYVQQGVLLAGNFHHDGDSWEKGLFENFDFHIASSVLSFRYGISIADVLSKMRPGETGALAKTYAGLCEPNGWTPSDFCNEARKRFGLSTKQHGAINSSANDEYRALIAIMERETIAAQRIFVVSEFERDLLQIRFEGDRVAGEIWRKEVAYA